MSQRERRPGQPFDMRWMEIFVMATEIGISIVIPIGIAVGAGILLDTLMGTRPLFLLILTIIGMFVSGFTFYRTMNAILKLSNSGRTRQRRSSAERQRLEDEAGDTDSTISGDGTPSTPRLRTYPKRKYPLPDDDEEEDD